MSEISEDIPKLELNQYIFKKIKFFISGHVQEDVVDLLKQGGAERLNYFSDYVTHLIVGDNPEENDIVDATDVYEIPALTPKWVLMCTALKKLVNTKPYLYSRAGKLFSNIVFCFSGVKEDLLYLWSLITYNGGTVQLNLNRRCHYLVTTNCVGTKYEKAESLGPEIIRIVTPDWVVETVANNEFVDASLFHPKLINWPKPVKHESTTAITGFEPEQVENQEITDEKPISDSTQALLDKLKQRMPWNQPSTPHTTISDPVAPPNVVAPSFVQKPNQPNQKQVLISESNTSQPQPSVFSQITKSPSSLPTAQVPRSIVHHTPNQQAQQEQIFHLQSQNPLNISRLIGQQAARPNLTNMKSQLGQNQLHQQLMQQRLAQHEQQRGSLQQHLLQQQLVQNQNNQILSQTPISQHQIISNQQLTQLQQQQQLQMKPNQQQLINQQQINQQQINQQQQISQQQQIVRDQQMTTNQQQITSQASQIINQQAQQNINQQVLHQQQILLNQNQKQNQQQQLNQHQLNQNQQVQQMIHNQQQIQLNPQQSQIQVNQNQQVINQQLLQGQVLHPIQQHTKTINQQVSQQLQAISQAQNFNQQTLTQHTISRNTQQQILPQKQFINQQQNTANPQIIQNQPNTLLQQQQFPNNNFNQEQSIVQQNINQGINPQLNVQALNQQLSTQNLGQQLNQQQLNQHLNLNQQQQQQTQQINAEQIGQQIISQNQLNLPNSNMAQHNLNQQQLNRQNLQQQQINRQSQQNTNQQPNLQHQLNPINQQVNANLPQQAVRSSFQPQPKLGQQILINQTSPQNPQAPRHVWSQQQNQVPGQQIVRHPVNVVQQAGPRVQWSPNSQQGNPIPQRQFIQLDARTHNELQKMSPEQQALFVAKLRHRQLQQRGSHILIRGNVPPGLTTQQQVQWLQQQAKQQGIVLPPNIQQQNITPGTLSQPGLAQNVQHAAPGLSPINQNVTQFAEQNQQQLQLRQYRLQQLQLQREQAQKNHLTQQQVTIQQPTIIRPIGQPPLADSTTNPPQVPEGNLQHSLVVNAKTKTALANMLSIKLQSGGSSVGVQRSETIQEPSAAGTLRLMTAQHNAALNSKPQEIIALQRRTISGPNGEIIKPPGTPLPVTPNNESLKLQYCPKLPLQHRPGPFYGHNPNLKLPPDLFLLGCIFVVVEIENFLEEKMPGWQQKIEKHGGEVEKQYCSRVTHVLCETQRHGVVMQALRDCKRCVTILWLSDVIQRKQVLPPWTALHLPNIYLDITPASKHLISICGFNGNERNRVKRMIKYTGAKCTTYFSKHNTLLISAKAEGKKCTYAKKWQIPIVNVQWLTDIMLGHFTAMNQMEHQIYQQFSTPPNFSFDPKLVPNLMVAWKAPINISQESYERVKRSASPVVLPKKSKKLKQETTDENDNINEDQVVNSTHKILFSMIIDTKEMQQFVRDLGGALAKDHQDFTHLVMPYLARSNKLFFAIAKGAQVISDQWLRDSHEAKQFLPEHNYNLSSKEFNYEYKCDIDQTFLTKNRNKLLEGKSFFVTPSVFPSRKIVMELIQACGGVVERVRRSASQIEATNVTSPYSYFIITHENDLHLVSDLLKNKKDKMKIICNAELIFSAILKQTFEVEPYAVCVL